jgi:hypothetical protein
VSNKSVPFGVPFGVVIRVNRGFVEGVTVTGVIEVITPGEELGMLRGRWKNTPATNIRGYGSLIHDNRYPLHTAGLAFKLLCKEEDMDWLHRAFMCGLASPHGAIDILINITFPDEMGDDFWKEVWREKEWLVVDWQVYSAMWRADIRK